MENVLNYNRASSSSNLLTSESQQGQNNVAQGGQGGGVGGLMDLASQFMGQGGGGCKCAQRKAC